MEKFDYIIAGCGLAGCSLLMHMMLHSYFSSKKILVIDKADKIDNDHTWCFWEKQQGVFEQIVYHGWNHLDFFSESFSGRFNISPYQYKMIRSIDLYNCVLQKAKQQSNIYFYYGNITGVTSEKNCAAINVDGLKFTASYVFNSIVFNGNIFSSPSARFHFLWQHFKGWYIQTPSDVFDETIATFMDFRVLQNNETIFVYVLPFSKTQALIEYTLFSKKLLKSNEYDDALKNYISQYLKITNYKITNEEFGIIPMTDYKFPAGRNNIINIGTAGAQVKPSSGFAFQFIQKHSVAIVKALMSNKNLLNLRAFADKRFHIYDATLLSILESKKLSGQQIFSMLFKKNPPQRILKFLDNETVLSEELKIMRSVPSKVFLPAALKFFFKP